MSERPSSGERLAGVAGLALILAMFLFAWFGVPNVNGLDAFDAFDDWVNIILVFTAFEAISLALFGGAVARAPIPLSVATTVLGAASSVILIIYLISPPGIPTFGEVGLELDLGRKVGIWLGVISALGIAIGGFMAMQEEGATFGGAADRLSGRSGPGASPPPPPPPPGGGAGGAPGA